MATQQEILEAQQYLAQLKGSQLNQDPNRDWAAFDDYTTKLEAENRLAEQAAKPKETIFDKLKKGATSMASGFIKNTPQYVAGKAAVDTLKGTYESAKALPGKLKEDVTEAAKDITTGIQKTGGVKDILTSMLKSKLTGGTVLGGLEPEIQKGLVKSVARTAGDVASTAYSPIGSAVGSVMEQTGAQGAIEFIAKKLVETSGIANNPEFQKFAMEHPNAEEDLNRALVLVMAGKDNANLSKMASQAKTGLKGEVAGVKAEAGDAYKNYQAKQAVKDADLVDKLVGTVSQGKIQDLPTVKRTLSDIDVSDIKTYKDLGDTLDAKISTIAGKLDEVLGTNTETKPLSELKFEKKVKTKTGEQTVSHNYVSDALQQLGEYYNKTNNVEKAAQIEQLKQAAESTGLTVQDINNIAKLHGQDLNAFNANGELSTGLTKQAAENTRKGLKNTGRDIFGNKVYDAADSELTNLYRTRDLVRNVEEKVNTLKQKIQERSLGAKAGYLLGKVINLLGLGTPKGFVESLIPRGQGFKVMNALDLEKTLNKNLQKIQKLNLEAPESDLIKQMEDIIQSSKQNLTNQTTQTKTKNNLNIESFNNPAMGEIANYEKIKPLAIKTQTEINDIANKMINKYGGQLSDPGIKTKQSYTRKVMDELGGDETKITDTARNSIVHSDSERIYNIVKDDLKLKNKLVKSDYKFHETNGLGFQGGNIRVKGKSGIVGEIQVVSPEMVFAKESSDIAKSILGEVKYKEMLDKFGDIGGKGHKYYEDWRIIEDKTSKEAMRLAQDSKDYYKQFLK